MTSSSFVFSCVCAIVASQTLCYADAQSSSSDDDGSSGDGSWAGEPGDRQEAWIFVSIPRYGVVPLQELQDQNTSAYLAWLDVGEPIESYEPVAMHSLVANDNNGAVVVLMLPERCLGDFNNDGRVDLYDAPAFVEAFLREDPRADLTRDGWFDIRDQILFLQLTTIPCVNGW